MLNGTAIENNLLDLFIAEEMARVRDIATRWQYYTGKHPRPLKVRPGQPDDNIIVNFVRIVVDKGVSFLFGNEVTFEIDEVRRTEAEEWLDAAWEANNKMLLLQKLALNGAVAGHAFAKIVPGAPYPRIIVLDPATVTVRWAPDDIERVLLYRIQYTALDPQAGRMVNYRQDIRLTDEGWVIADFRAERGGEWRTVNEERWPYAWPPIVDCQNLPAPNSFWGDSDISDDIIQLNRAMNFILSNIARIIRFHAHPKTWGRGFTADQLRIGVDETIVLPSPEAELRNLEMQSDLASSIAAFERLREAFHEVTCVPEVAVGKMDRVGALSGVALQILYRPLVERTEVKRRLYGKLITDLNARLLEMGGYGAGINTVLHWPELLPADPLQERQVALLDQQLGVSQDTILARLGYDPDLEREKREVRTAELGERLLSAFDGGE